MYRVSLALFEAKLQYCQRGVQMITGHDDDYYQLRNPADFVQLCKTKPIMPDPISRAINAIGNVKVYDRQYYPKFAAIRTDNAERFIPQSEHIILSNLRETVVALADNRTPVETRRRFYNNCPIPGAIWREFLLQNPDEIIPDGYTTESLADDMDDIQPKIDYLAKKLPKYFTEPISFDFEGSKSLFSSNKQSGLRIRDRNQGEALNDYYSRMRIEGDIDGFDNIEHLTSAEQLSATLCLLGERPLTAAAMYPAYVTRDERVCGQHSSLGYKAACSIIYSST